MIQDLVFMKEAISRLPLRSSMGMSLLERYSLRMERSYIPMRTKFTRPPIRHFMRKPGRSGNGEFGFF